MSVLDDPRLDWSLLERFGFDRPRFERDAARIASGALTEASAIFDGPIEPADGVIPVDPDDPALAEIGAAALAAGKVAVVVLNGGMATRFGNVVKGVVEVFDGLSFIALKAEDVRRAERRFGAEIPFVLMNSFATEAQTAAHLEANGDFGLPAVLSFAQSISIRLTPSGALFIGADGRPSYHAPGHGDFFVDIRRSGVLAQLRERGVEVIAFSNVDNLGATISPAIIGQHLASKAAMSAEVTAKRRTASGAWDKGGAPCVAGGRRQLMEGFRFPATLAPDFLPDFSTNNFLFDARAIDRPLDLPRHVVKKSVDDAPALQLESITCEASALYEDDRAVLPLGLLRVPREGPSGRFFPVKERVDLEVLAPILKARLHAGWAARDGAG